LLFCFLDLLEFLIYHLFKLIRCYTLSCAFFGHIYFRHDQKIDLERCHNESISITRNMSSNNLIDIFAEFQKNMFREIGGLMGAVVGVQTAPVVNSSFDSAALEARILAAVDARLKAFEPLRVGAKRPRTPSIESEDDEEQTAPMAPLKVTQQTILSFFEDKTVRDLTASLTAASLNDTVVEHPAPVTPAPTPIAPASPAMKAEAPVAPSSPIMAPEAPAPEEVEKSGSESDDEAEEEADEEEEEDDDEEEDLTEINYKGKRYFMDGEYNIYGLDADGELVEEPVGRYDEKTRRILFN
jgi:hypothetical protein